MKFDISQILSNVAKIVICCITIVQGISSVDDVYMNRTGQTRAELIASGDYIQVSIFGSTEIRNREIQTLEEYLPVAARTKGDKTTIRGYPNWPKTFEENLAKVKYTANLVKFTVHTLRSKPDGEVISDKNLTSFKRSTWNASAGVKILVHGFKQRGSNPKMPQAQKDAYLLMENQENIVIVDWAYLANEPNYFEAAMNSQKVGKRLGEFIIWLKNHGLTKSYLDFHLIGYCLGAHVSGVAGRYVQDHSGGGGKIWRITGLDPAGPGVQAARNEIYLDHTDALYVDIIHTNAGFNFRGGEWGIVKQSGHIDFFPNGGVQQPVCGEVHAVGNLVSKCSHKKAADYYTRSIKGEIFRSCKCPSWGQFVNKVCECGGGTFMGEYLSPVAKGPHYLRVFEYTLFEIFEQLGVLPSDK